VAVPHIALLTALVRSLDAQRPSRRD